MTISKLNGNETVKKIISLIVVCLTCAAFSSGCFGKSSPTYGPKDAYWTKTPTNIVNDIDETLTYSIVHTPLETDGNTKIVAEYTDGKMTTQITNTTIDNKKVYQYKTVFTINVLYKIGEENFTFTDEVVSLVNFDWNGVFTPIHSEKTTKSTIPVSASGDADSKGNKVVTLNHKTEIDYASDGKAVSKFTILGDKTSLQPYYTLTDGATSDYSKLFKKNFLDNDMILFALRSFNLEGSTAADFTYSFNTIDALSNSLQSMRLSYVTENESFSENITFDNLLIDGVGKKSEISTNRIGISISDTFNGATIVCNYATDHERQRKRLIKMKTTLPYSLGYLTYTLSEVKLIEG